MGLHLPVAGFIPVFTDTYRLFITLHSKQFGSWQETDGTFMGLTEKGFVKGLVRGVGQDQGHQ